MKKLAILLTTFVLLGACEESVIDPQIVEVAESVQELEVTETAAQEIMEIAATTSQEIVEIPAVVFEEEIFLVVEEQASFKGGMSAWASHVKENLEYPEQAKRLGIEGRVFLSFIVDKHGSLSNIQLVKGIGAGCDQAALNMLKASPDWLAAKQRGRNVNSRMQVAVTFKIPE